ncbi:GntR family transcriptional regulator [Bacillus sp. 03113]|uniref:GntR family transcriptional regulator n=1 Tax=Bacillus sp. 03113 TaxID=2578211 RepID=UPI0011424D35|nr:GntR family transcriptional regulator [Bacillus sp. 03113]
MIDKSSPLPIYYQLEELIKKKIEIGELQPNDILPSEREYSEYYQISRMTVRQAFTNLVNDGYLYRRKGKGTFVAEKKFEQELIGLTSFTEEMKKRGLTPSSKMLHFELIPATKKMASMLKIKENEPVYEIIRIRLADKEPMAFETLYMSANLVKGLTAEIASHSLYEYIEEKSGLKMAHASQTIESSIATDAEAQHLNIPKGSPILLFHRHSYLENNTPIEVAKSSYRADRYKFSIHIKRQKD